MFSRLFRTSHPDSLICKQSENLQFFEYFEISSKRESISFGSIKSNFTLLNPGVSIILVPSHIGIISQCLVVCVPLLNFSLTSPVFNLIFGLSAFIKLDFPTPEFPHSADNFPLSNLAKYSIPLLDLYYNSGVVGVTVTGVTDDLTTYFYKDADGTHPNQNGYNYIYPKIARFLMQL